MYELRKSRRKSILYQDSAFVNHLLKPKIQEYRFELQTLDTNTKENNIDFSSLFNERLVLDELDNSAVSLGNYSAVIKNINRNYKKPPSTKSIIINKIFGPLAKYENLYDFPSTSIEKLSSIVSASGEKKIYKNITSYDNDFGNQVLTSDLPGNKRKNCRNACFPSRDSTSVLPLSDTNKKDTIKDGSMPLTIIPNNILFPNTTISRQPLKYDENRNIIVNQTNRRQKSKAFSIKSKSQRTKAIWNKKEICQKIKNCDRCQAQTKSEVKVEQYRDKIRRPERLKSLQDKTADFKVAHSITSKCIKISKKSRKLLNGCNDNLKVEISKSESEMAVKELREEKRMTKCVISRKDAAIFSHIFACTMCDYKTPNGHYFKVHNKRHLDIKPHKCSHCTYASVERSKLIRHMFQHTGIRPHKCNKCSYNCIQKISLNNHIKKYHNNYNNLLV